MNKQDEYVVFLMKLEVAMDEAFEGASEEQKILGYMVLLKTLAIQIVQIVGKKAFMTEMHKLVKIGMAMSREE